MNFKPADTRRRYAKAIDALSDPSGLGTVIVLDGGTHKNSGTGYPETLLWVHEGREARLQAAGGPTMKL